MFLEHGDPSRRVAPNHDALVVGVGVTVDGCGAEHGVEASQHLVSGGDGGALVAPAHGEGLVVAVEPALGGACGAVSAFDEDVAQTGVAASAFPGAALAGAFVVAGAQPGPCGAVSQQDQIILSSRC